MLSIARCFVALATIAFGVQQMVLGAFVTRLIPALPAWIPFHSALAYASGLALIASGALMLTRRFARPAAIAVAAAGLASAVLLYAPRLAFDVHNGGLWTATGKALALAGAAFLVAASWSAPTLVRIGSALVGSFLVLAGIQHFIYAPFVAQLVPAWIPAPLFWGYFAGVALIAGGLGMNAPRTAWLAAMLSGGMIFTWVLILHVPRALTIRNANETTAVFEALAMSGACWLAAAIGNAAPEPRARSASASV